ncbi:MAG TPA: amylo-alpha-1,6-glucosidase [Candidatus Baltobacteraceae bacterium]|nr:amylo-alpha-1,6-glucosidase [Candidatus Baltobacteraceae bacterium]
MVSSYDAQHNEFCAYVLPETETPFGLTLGNFKTFASSTPKGGVRGLWDADTDQIIFGTHQIAYRLRDRDRTFFPHQIVRDFTFLPYAQISEFALEERLLVTECFYVPHGPKNDRTVAFIVEVTLHNPGRERVEAAVFPWALLVGQRFYGEPEKEVHAAVVGPHVRVWNSESGASRWWGGSREPHAVVVSLREQVLLAAMKRGVLRDDDHLESVTPALAEYVSGRIFGASEYRIPVAPGAREALRLAIVFDRRGDAFAKPQFDDLLADPRALHETQRYYATALSDARFMVPSPVISRGVVWAKSNMLRIIKEYPQGWGATNSPPSDILVSRDTSWFVHGFDYFLPAFSRDAIEVFNRFVEPSGEVVEYVRGVSGFTTSYDLNINDDTPLHLIAILHHYNATLDEAWVQKLLPLIVKITDYLLSQRDNNGLIYCSAKGVDMYGISSWRNIIPYYTLDGAVTEINAEAVFALEAAAMLCAVAGDRAHWESYARQASELREKMMTHLFNSDTGAFVLNYDRDGNYQDNLTADEVFPVLFGVANPAQRRAILQRLSEADFVTPVGLRTISTADSWYFPSHGFGLLGGVWPDLTLWFAVALARNGFIEESARWLEQIYASMEAGAQRNTVPGQFAEWFDGGSLTNRGMYLSPWTGAKYLWGVAETVCGLDGYRTSGRPHLSPLLPAGWQWTAGVRVHWGTGRCTYVVDAKRRLIFGDMREASAEEPYRCVYAGVDVSGEATTSPIEVGAVAFEDDKGAVRVFLCNLLDETRDVTLEFRGRILRRRVPAGELAQMVLSGAPLDVATSPAAPDLTGAVLVEGPA